MMNRRFFSSSRLGLSLVKPAVGFGGDGQSVKSVSRVSQSVKSVSEAGSQVS